MTFIYLIELHVQGAKGLTNIRKDNVVCYHSFTYGWGKTYSREVFHSCLRKVHSIVRCIIHRPNTNSTRSAFFTPNGPFELYPLFFNHIQVLRVTHESGSNGLNPLWMDTKGASLLFQYLDGVLELHLSKS